MNTSAVSQNVTGSFTNQTTWTFAHGFNNRNVIVQAFDTGFNQLIPQSITLTDSNTATITFPIQKSGYAIASLGGANGIVYGDGLNALKLTSQVIPSGSWSLVGSYYQYTLTNANIVATGYIDFIPSNASILEVTSCKMLPQIDTTNGTGTFYAQFPPQSDIIGNMIIYII
jgi:hypothetical protein